MKFWMFVVGIALVVLVQAAPREASGQNSDLDCLIEPSQIVTVSMPAEGLLETVTVDRGDLVEKGQVLATLESSVERATVAVARARAAIEASIKGSQVRIDFGDRRLTRTELAYKEGGLPLKELDEAETSKILAEIGLLEAKENKRLAEVELERAEAALALRTILSPVRGVVMQRLLYPGEFVKQAPILKLAQIDPLYVEVIVPVAYLGKVAPGMVAQVMPEPPVNGTYKARVIVVDRVVDAASGTFGVRLGLPNPDYRLPAGLKCTIRFPR
jgi:RND family efflux transporter MFP subunit